MNIEHLVFDNGPKRVGPSSHAVRAGDFLFITGVLLVKKGLVVSDPLEFELLTRVFSAFFDE